MKKKTTKKKVTKKKATKAKYPKPPVKFVGPLLDLSKTAKAEGFEDLGLELHRLALICAGIRVRA